VGSAKQSRRLRAALAGLALLAAVAGLVQWGARRLPMEQRRAELERALSAAWGREVRFAGEFRLEILPRPQLEATRVTLANAPGRLAPHALAIDTLRLEVALWPLLARRVRLAGLEIDGAQLRLEAGPGGLLAALPPLGRLAGEGADADRPLAVDFDRIELRNLGLAWSGAATGERTLRIDALEVAAEDEEGPVAWSARGALPGGAFDLAASTGPLRALLHPSGAWPVSLEGRVGEAKLRVSGQVERPPPAGSRRGGGLALDAEAELEAPDLRAAGAPFGLELPALGPFGFTGRVRGSAERLESQGVARLGATRLEGRASLQLAGRARPRVDAELRTAELRLEDLGLAAGLATAVPEEPAAPEEPLAPAEPAAPEEPPAPAWTGREPLPFGALRRLDARLALAAERIDSGCGVDVRDASVAAELEDGELRVSDLRLAVQDGSVEAGLRVDARAESPEVALRLDATALDVGRLGRLLGRAEDAGSGQLDLALDLRGRGATPAGLWQGLDGRVALALREWSAAGAFARRFLLDLVRAFLGPERAAADRVGCLRAAVGFAAGVGSVETLVLSTRRATVVGQGRIDLARERWDLELVPREHDPGLLVVAPAVRVTGPLGAPSVQPVPLELVSASLRSLVGATLRPAGEVAGGARRLLGPAGRLLAPVQGAIDLATGERAGPPDSECVLPPPPPG
jgi:uncharacterized protein involved in outer membrane biogenesis